MASHYGLSIIIDFNLKMRKGVGKSQRHLLRPFRWRLCPYEWFAKYTVEMISDITGVINKVLNSIAMDLHLIAQNAQC